MTSPTFPSGKTVTLITRTVTGQDSYGNDITSGSSAAIDNCPVWPRGSTEQVQGQDIVITRLTALLPPTTDVSAVDAVEIDGDRYEVDGQPGTYLNPFTGTDPGVEVNLKKVTG